MGERERSEISESDISVKGELGTFVGVGEAIVKGAGATRVVWGAEQWAATSGCGAEDPMVKGSDGSFNGRPRRELQREL